MEAIEAARRSQRSSMQPPLAVPPHSDEAKEHAATGSNGQWEALLGRPWTQANVHQVQMLNQPTNPCRCPLARDVRRGYTQTTRVASERIQRASWQSTGTKSTG